MKEIEVEKKKREEEENMEHQVAQSIENQPSAVEATKQALFTQALHGR